MYDGSNVSYISYPIANLTTGVWYHLSFTWDGTKESMRLYVNGKSVGTRTDVGNITTTGIANPGSFRIGQWSSPEARYLNGAVDEVRIWNTTRTAAEIKGGMYGTVATGAAGLLAYYKLDEGSGTVTNNNSTSASVVANSNGTLVNGTTWLASSPVQGNENALHFDSVNDYVAAAPNANYDFTTGTIECWVRTENLVGNTTIIAIRNTTTTRYSFHMGNSLIGLWNGSSWNYINYSFSPGQWYHLAFVCTPSATTIYVNGISIGNTGNVVGTAMGLPLHIGLPFPTATNEQFSGSMDEIRIWNTARTQAQIQANMNTSLTGTEANLVALFGFNQGIAAANNTGLVTAIDGTANNNHGTLNNFGLTGSSSNWVSHSTSSVNPAPVVTSFTPAAGAVGATVIINGNNFNTTPANNVVYFGATKATVTAASTTSLTVIVPSGASYQPISVLNTAYGLTGYSSKPFTTLFNDGARSFKTNVNFTVSGNPYGVAVGDIDGDGKADMVAVDITMDRVSVYRNISASGSITTSSFAPKVDFTTGVQPIKAVIKDVDGDGRQDVIVATTDYTGAGFVSVLQNTSTSGTISFAAKVDFATGWNSLYVAVGDLDGDGKPELVLANTNSDLVGVFRNTFTSGAITTSSFAPRVDFPTGQYPSGVAIGDVDGDGKPEIITANSGGTISVLRSTATIGALTSTSFAPKVDFAAGARPEAIAIADMDGDGKLDIVVSNSDYNAGSVSILRNTATAGTILSSSLSGKVSFATGSYSSGMSIGDVDGDGKPDIAVANRYSNNVSVLLNTATSGSIAASSLTKTDYTSGVEPSDVAISDLDNDGKPDLVIANFGDNYVSVLQNVPLSTLPVAGLSFTATKKATSIGLTWSTLSESNTHSFDVERSPDGRNFTAIGTVKATGLSAQKTEYSFEDRSPLAGTNYYRLKQRDVNERIKHSGVLLVRWGTEDKLIITLAPQPMHDVMTVSISGITITKGNFVLYDVAGKVRKSYPVTTGGSTTFEVTRSGMAYGIYFYKLITDKGETASSGKVLVQ